VAKNIVVKLSVSANQGHAAEDLAISMAAALGAHLTGAAFVGRSLTIRKYSTWRRQR
jgi:hypothetical protein